MKTPAHAPYPASSSFEADAERQPRLGIDIGRVLIAGDGVGDTSFFGRSEADAMLTPEVPGALAAVARLVPRFEGRVWLVSKCGARIRERSRAWLRHHDFFALTRVREEDMHFCRERSEKAEICARLEITHFVDDRLDVLEAMRALVPHRFLFGASSEYVTPDGEIATPTWAHVERAIAAVTPRGR
jgi:hypothetical protein